LNLNLNYFPDSHIPEFLGSLNNLRYLDLSQCHFGGKIPSQFRPLSHLKYLNLAGNELEGSIPPQLRNLSNLQELYLEGSYSGVLEIKDWGKLLSNLISLTHLYLCSIGGLNSSHTSLQKLPKLRELNLFDCSLSDHFILSLRPYEFNFSTSLLAFDLSGNTFTSPVIFPWVSNITSNLVELYLADNNLEGSVSNHFGMAMNSLEHLDLSLNSFKGEVLESFMNICTLHSLGMCGNNLTEDLPSILHNLSTGCIRYSLQDLDLTYNQITGSLPDLSAFSALKSLDLSGNRLDGKIKEGNKLLIQLEILSISSNFLEGGIPRSFGNACVFRSLEMDNNRLSDEFSMIIQHLSGCAKYSLQELNLRGNQINGMLSNLSAFSTLKSLDLSYNRLNGKIIEGNKLPTQLESFSISSNFLEGGIPKSFGNSACALRILDMMNNSLSDEFSMIIHHLSGCATYSLETLDLSMNEINGTLPDLSIFSSLKALHVDRNKLNGEISKNIQFPPQLGQLTMPSNSLNGVFTNYHFANVSKLFYLDLSHNSLTLTFTQNWVPPFQLSIISLRSCMLGPTFPKWLQTQSKLVDIDISNAGILDMVPRWFWAKLAFRNLVSVDISNNNLYGIIPKFSRNNIVPFLTLASNQFEGPIPPFLRATIFLDLSNNNFSDSLSFLCASDPEEALYQLDISNNQLFGQIPDCWSHFKSLTYLDLSDNKFLSKILLRPWSQRWRRAPPRGLHSYPSITAESTKRKIREIRF